MFCVCSCNLPNGSAQQTWHNIHNTRKSTKIQQVNDVNNFAPFYIVYTVHIVNYCLRISENILFGRHFFHEYINHLIFTSCNYKNQKYIDTKMKTIFSNSIFFKILKAFSNNLFLKMLATYL